MMYHSQHAVQDEWGTSDCTQVVYNVVTGYMNIRSTTIGNIKGMYTVQQLTECAIYKSCEFIRDKTMVFL